MLPCHSFPHTDLKSPCAEQESATTARIDQRKARAAEAQRLSAIAKTNEQYQASSVLRWRHEQVKRRREALDAERQERCAEAVSDKLTPRGGTTATVLLLAGDYQVDVAANAALQKTAAVMSRVYVQAVEAVAAPSWQPAAPSNAAARGSSPQLRPTPPPPRTTSAQATATTRPVQMPRPMSAATGTGSATTSAGQSAAGCAAQQGAEHRSVQAQQRPRTAPPAHGGATHYRPTEVALPEEGEVTADRDRGRGSARTTEEQWKEYERETAEAEAAKRLRRRRQLQPQRRRLTHSQTERFHHTQWASHARTIRARRPASAISASPPTAETQQPLRPATAAGERYRHCELAVDCTPPVQVRPTSTCSLATHFPIQI